MTIEIPKDKENLSPCTARTIIQPGDPNFQCSGPVQYNSKLEMYLCTKHSQFFGAPISRTPVNPQDPKTFNQSNNPEKS